MNTRNRTIFGAVAVSFSAMLWGFDGIVLTPRLYNLDVAYVVFILHAIPFILMNMFFFNEYRHLPAFNRSDVIYLLLISFFGGMIGTLAIVKALFLVNFQHLTIVVLLQKLQPVFGIALAAILLKEKLGKHFIFWASMAIAGGYFLTFGFHLPSASKDHNTITAALYALLASFSFGSSTVFSKKILLKYSFKTATFYRYGITTFLLLLVMIVTGSLSQIKETTNFNWFIILVISLTTGSGAIFLYYYGLTRIRAIIAVVCELFFPISAIVFDYLFNDAKLSLIQWLSAAFMVFAIINLNSDRTRIFDKTNQL